MIENSAVQTSIPQAFAKHPLKENWESQQNQYIVHKFVSSRNGLIKKCRIIWYHIRVSFSIFRRDIHFVPNQDAIWKGAAYLPSTVTLRDHSPVQTHYTLTHTQSHKVIVASDISSFIIRPRHILHQLMVSDWWMRYVINGKQYDLCRWFHPLHSLLPLLTALYSALIFK